jgi:hypothetical protein
MKPRKRIVLVRHGKPEAAINPWVSAAGFARWVRQYNKSGISPGSGPPVSLQPVEKDVLVLASASPRAMQSAVISLGKQPDLKWPELKEMEIPRYRFPGRLPAYVWLCLCRAAWMLGVKGRAESYMQAKQRAVRAAVRLHNLANSHDHILVFGHGMMSLHIANVLHAKGWRGRVRPLGYWGTICLERDT